MNTESGAEIQARKVSSWLCRVLAAGLLFLGNHAHAEPIVVVSLKPIHSLVANVMRGVSTPALVVPDGPLPEGRWVSQPMLDKIGSADVIIWVGEPADAGLTAALAKRNALAHLVTLADSPGVLIPPWFRDSHAWLDPQIAIAMADSVAVALSRADPVNIKAYEENARKLKAALERLDSELKVDLIPLHKAQFLIYEDSFEPLISRYALAGGTSISIDPAQRRHLGGIDTAQLQALRAGWQKRGMRCLFYEPQADRNFVRLLVDGTDVTIAPLDPYGSAWPAGPAQYGEMMRGVRDAILRCVTDSK